jgi:hypothetical protein
VRINDPAHVARQYASEANLEARRSLYADAEGPDPRQIAFDAVAEVARTRVRTAPRSSDATSTGSNVAMRTGG